MEKIIAWSQSKRKITTLQELFIFTLATGLMCPINSATASCKEPTTKRESQLCCQNYGGVLPNLITRDEVNSVTKEMTNNQLDTVWLGIYRKKFGSWRWINGGELEFQPDEITGHCVYIRLDKSERFHAPCNDQSRGFVCLKRGCSSCRTLDIDFHGCVIHTGSCYLFFCDKMNWLNARRTCRQMGTDLAITKDADILRKSMPQGCSSFWIGAFREIWFSEGSHKTSFGLWADGEPAERGNCSVYKKMGNDFFIHANKCDAKYPSVCIAVTDFVNSTRTTRVMLTETVAYINQTSKSSVGDTVHNIALIVGIVFGILFLVVVSYIMYWLIMNRNSGNHGPESNPLIPKDEVRKLAKKIARQVDIKYNRTWTHSMSEYFDITSLDDIYTPLLFSTTGDKENVVESYQKILTQLKDKFITSFRILIHGEPGCGKTTLAKRIANDWAMSVLKDKPKDSVVCKFTLVIPLFLRHISKGTEGFKDAVRKSFNLTDDEVQLISRILANQPESILVVCDGYDEFKEDHCSELSLLVKGELDPINIIIMSRDSAVFAFDKTSECPNLTLRLRGFSEKTREDYIGNFFGKESNMAEVRKMLKEMKGPENEYIKKLSLNPSILFHICNIWRKKGTLYKDLTLFYINLTRYILTRYELKYVPPNDRALEKNIIKKYHNVLEKLGKLAFDKLNEKDQAVTEFSLLELNEIAQDVLEFGFLRELTEGRYPRVSFLDENMQEFLAALFVVSSTACRENHNSQFRNLKFFDTFRQSSEINKIE